MRSSASTTPPPTGTVAPVVPVPRPRATKGVACVLQSCTTAHTCSWVVANTTASGNTWRRLLSLPYGQQSAVAVSTWERPAARRRPSSSAGFNTEDTWCGLVLIFERRDDLAHAVDVAGTLGRRRAFGAMDYSHEIAAAIRHHDSYVACVDARVAAQPCSHFAHDLGIRATRGTRARRSDENLVVHYPHALAVTCDIDDALAQPRGGRLAGEQHDTVGTGHIDAGAGIEFVVAVVGVADGRFDGAVIYQRRVACGSDAVEGAAPAEGERQHHHQP